MKEKTKPIFLFALELMIAISLVGCASGESKYEDYFADNNEMFVVVEKHGRYEIIVDESTGVEYIRHTSDPYKESLSVRLDKDGKPIIYEGAI